VAVLARAAADLDQPVAQQQVAIRRGDQDPAVRDRVAVAGEGRRQRPGSAQEVGQDARLVRR
jgi:hypothetical protein